VLVAVAVVVVALAVVRGPQDVARDLEVGLADARLGARPGLERGGEGEVGLRDFAVCFLEARVAGLEGWGALEGWRGRGAGRGGGGGEGQGEVVVGRGGGARGAGARPAGQSPQAAVHGFH